MKLTVIKYKIAPDRVDENVRYVRAIFSQLRDVSPDGLHYASMTSDDGSFMHMVRTDEHTADGALTSLESFRVFRAGFQERAIEPSTFTEFELVGNFKLF